MRPPPPPGPERYGLMAQENPKDVLIATESGCAEIDGVDHHFVKGVTRIARSHPLAKAHGQWFREAEDHLTYEVEDTEASPGSKRGQKK